MVVTQKADGFSPYVSFILIISNLIRIFWWFLERFSLIILNAAIVSVICQVAMLYIRVYIIKLNTKNQGSA